jgi:hypothetical protein
MVSAKEAIAETTANMTTADATQSLWFSVRDIALYPPIRISLEHEWNEKRKSLDHESHEFDELHEYIFLLSIDFTARHSRNQKPKKLLEHESRKARDKLHKYRLLNVIPAKAGIHFRTKSYADMFQEITTRIQEYDSEQCRGNRDNIVRFRVPLRPLRLICRTES